jgi:hypothetical protein
MPTDADTTAATAASLLGQQLTDFLLKQLATPAGSTDTLGFLGTGIAVEPNSFLSQGQFNPARVDSWLSIVVDPLGVVLRDSNRVESTLWTASELMATLASQAQCVAPVGSDEQQTFAHTKSLAAENMGGATTVSTAPLDWYDPAQIPQWPTCKLAAGTGSGSGTSTSTGTGTGTTVQPHRSSGGGTIPGPPSHEPLMQWRTLPNVSIAEPTPPQPAAAPAAGGTVFHAGNDLIHAELFKPAANRVPAAALVQKAQPAPAEAPAEKALAATRVLHFSPVSDTHTIPLGQAANAFISEREMTSVSAAQAVSVSQAISTAASQASSSAVASSSLSLSLSYLVVELSRAPWWSDLLLLLDNWYIPGTGRAALVAASDDQKTIGVPVALILTYDVKIQAQWSDSDRAAASSSTHFGPWMLTSAQFTSATDGGGAILTIPGIQAIACIYRELPAIPPKADPGLGNS